MIPPIGYAGVDWAIDAHAVCVVDTRAWWSSSSMSTHTADGLARAVPTGLSAPGSAGSAIERPDGPVVDALLEAGLEVVVVVERSVKALRERYGTSGNKSDRSDAYVLADCLRTDGHRWRALEPRHAGDGHAASPRPRPQGPRRDTGSRSPTSSARTCGSCSPALWACSRDIDSPITPAVPRAVPLRHPRRLALREAPRRLAARQRLLRPQDPAELHARLDCAPRAALIGDDGDARGAITLAYVAVLKTLRAQIDELDTRIDELLDAHPDAASSVAAPLRHRPRRDPARRDRRLPSPVPRPRVPRLPRRRRPLHPRQRPAPRRHLPLGRRQEAPRRALRLRRRQLARQPLGRRPLPPAPRRGKTHPHAERILARSWAHIIWRCWQDHTPYDPARHGAHQRLHAGRVDIGLLTGGVQRQAGAHPVPAARRRAGLERAAEQGTRSRIPTSPWPPVASWPSAAPRPSSRTSTSTESEA